MSITIISDIIVINTISFSCWFIFMSKWTLIWFILSKSISNNSSCYSCCFFIFFIFNTKKSLILSLNNIWCIVIICSIHKSLLKEFIHIVEYSISTSFMESISMRFYIIKYILSEISTSIYYMGFFSSIIFV